MTDQSLLIIGQTGQLARALASLSPDAKCLSRDTVDLSWEAERIRSALNEQIESSKPRGLILAAAYTQVDQAETDRNMAFAVNAVAPGIIAQVCAEKDLPLVHVSTDYVFDGESSRPWREDDPVAPLNTYGESKRAGEVAVLDSGAKAAILRTSWVYDLDGRNFATTMLRLAQDRNELRVVGDQIGRPTHADVLAQACLAALGHSGLFHVSGTGDPVSWAGFARAIFEEAGADVNVESIPSSEYPTPARRPAFSVMDTGRFEKQIGPLPDWRDSLSQAFAKTR